MLRESVSYNKPWKLNYNLVAEPHPERRLAEKAEGRRKRKEDLSMPIYSYPNKSVTTQKTLENVWWRWSFPRGKSLPRLIYSETRPVGVFPWNLVDPELGFIVGLSGARTPSRGLQNFLWVYIDRNSTPECTISYDILSERTMKLYSAVHEKESHHFPRMRCSMKIITLPSPSHNRCLLCKEIIKQG